MPDQAPQGASRSTRPSPSDAPPPTLAPPLWRLLTLCADAVAAVRQGQSLTDALARVPSDHRPGTQALAFTVLRHMGRAQALRKLLVPKAPAPWVDALLLSALALDGSERYAAHTLVDQAVEAAKRKHRAASGLVNAVLRRHLRERQALLAQVAQDPVALHNHPAWWLRRLQQDWPTQWTQIVAAAQQQPPLTLRANLRHQPSTAYRERLQSIGLLTPNALAGAPEASPAAACATASAPTHVPQADPIILNHAVPVTKLPGFDRGDASVQDAAAQLAAPLLLNAGASPLPAGARVLDACAAPGGKTAHLLELADLDVTALDSDPERLRRVHDTLDRLGLKARTMAADASLTAQWWDGRPFDAILLDAPCSASGIVRRHPDVRWLRRESDLASLARIQDTLLDALWPLLRPGGHLLYCTCSVFKVEGQDRIDAFLQRTPAARLLPSPGHLLPVVEYAEPSDGPQAAPGDGFYYALLAKPNLPA